MSAPQPSAAEDDAEEEAPDGFDDVSGSDDPEGEEVEVDLADTNIGEDIDDEIDQAFDAIENADRPNDPADDPDFDPFNGPGDDGDDADGSGGTDPSGDDIADAIVEGTARLAVLGLDDEFDVNGSTKSKADLQDEFKEVFSAFRLGEFGGQVAEEYLFVEEDIDPVMGFVAASLCCTAMVLWMRPDGEDIAKNAYDRVATIGTGGIGGVV